MGRQVLSSAHRPAPTGGCCLNREPAAGEEACGGPGSPPCHKHAHPSVVLGTKPRGAPRMTAPSRRARRRRLPLLIPDPFAGGELPRPPAVAPFARSGACPRAASAPTFTMCLLVSLATQPPCRTPAPLTLRNRYETPRACACLAPHHPGGVGAGLAPLTPALLAVPSLSWPG